MKLMFPIIISLNLAHSHKRLELGGNMADKVFYTESWVIIKQTIIQPRFAI